MFGSKEHSVQTIASPIAPTVTLGPHYCARLNKEEAAAILIKSAAMSPANAAMQSEANVLRSISIESLMQP